MSKFSHAELTLSTSAQLISTCESNLRTWLVSVQTLLNGSLVDINRVGADIMLETAFPDRIEIDEVYGLPDPRIVVFRVSEVTGVPGGLGVPLEVRVVPRYPEHVLAFFKLDERLAGLVGLPYLAHPKSSMNQIYTYIERNGLMTRKFIKCDKFLKDIFGVPCLRLRTLWESISSSLISKVSAQPLYNQLVLAETPVARKSGQTLNVDAAMNLYPVDWHLRETPRRVITRTKSMPANPMKAAAAVSSNNNVSSNKTAVESSKSSRTLKRHRSI